MKTYIFFFTLPDKTTLYITGKRNEVSINRFDAKEFKTEDTEDLKDHLQNSFNEAWDQKPGFSKQQIWKGASLNTITLNCEEILPISRETGYFTEYPEDVPGTLHNSGEAII